MQIAIISDIHENFHNLILALKEIKRRQVEYIICLGDLMNSGVAKLLASQDIPVYMVWGNNDGEKVEITQAASRLGSKLKISLNCYDFLDLGGKKIFISHYNDLAPSMAKSGDFDAVFYGHTHLKKKEKVGNCWMVNPGEIAASKTKIASFALYNTDKNEVEIIELKEVISLKTPLMEAYFKANASKMDLRSSKAMNLMENIVIPKESEVYKLLAQAANSARVLVISGLPGVGKSLYIHQFCMLAKQNGRKIDVIQWDIARKAFETPQIYQHFPMGDGVVHNGVKLSVGSWLINTLKKWLETHRSKEALLLIEAPLVGHRFIELAKEQEDLALEAFLKSEAFQVLLPIPSKTIRSKIEENRKALVKDDAKTWTGAKPAVMLMLWKMLCGIANELGKSIPMEGQPPYDPEVYAFVFKKILQHRNCIILPINEVFDTKALDEKELHKNASLVANDEEANAYALAVLKTHTEKEIDQIVASWYLT